MSLPVLQTCGDCAHYEDTRDGTCTHWGLDDWRDTDRNAAPPEWCPLRELQPKAQCERCGDAARKSGP